MAMPATAPAGGVGGAAREMHPVAESAPVSPWIIYCDGSPMRPGLGMALPSQ